jgi:hypothetical protein
MTRDETVALFLECKAKRAAAWKAALAQGKSENEAKEIAHEAAKAHWNAWAEDMLRQKAELEKAGTWNGDKSNNEWSDETRKWNEAARTDLSGLRFMTRAFADTAEKEGGQSEEGSGRADADVKTLIIEGDGIDFNEFVFPGLVGFVGAQFHEAAFFLDVQFRGEASFEGAQFYGLAHFGRARFKGKAGFWRAQFHGEAGFWGAWFHGEALFTDVQFYGAAWFVLARFQGQAWFASANFERSASFHDASFGSEEKPQHAYFTAIKSDRAFDLTGTQFSKVPAFSQADFKQAPDLDNVSFPPRPFWCGGDKDLVPQYRALKRLAVQGYDYEREQMAFKGELRSRRGTTDKWWHPSLLLGILYDGVADCGRSITQPFAVWSATIIAFAAFYWSRAIAGAETRCAEGDGTFVQALYLSVKNALVLFAGTRDARVNQAYEQIAK